MSSAQEEILQAIEDEKWVLANLLEDRAIFIKDLLEAIQTNNDADINSVADALYYCHAEINVVENIIEDLEYELEQLEQKGVTEM